MSPPVNILTISLIDKILMLSNLSPFFGFLTCGGGYPPIPPSFFGNKIFDFPLSRYVGRGEVVFDGFPPVQCTTIFVASGKHFKKLLN